MPIGWGPVALVLVPRFRHSGTRVVRRDNNEDAQGDDAGDGGFRRRSDDVVMGAAVAAYAATGHGLRFAWPYLALLSVGLAGWFGILRDDLILVISNTLVLGSVLVVISVKPRSRRLTFDHVELAVPAGTDPVTALEALVEIGPRLAADLRKVGITDAPSLRTVGIEETNRRLVESGLLTGAHSRQAIQAAISEESCTTRTPRGVRKCHRGPFGPKGNTTPHEVSASMASDAPLLTTHPGCGDIEAARVGPGFESI